MLGDVMTSAGLSMDRGIARCRLILSVSALVAIYLDPTEPAGGPMFSLAPLTLVALATHLAYSVAVYLVLKRPSLPPERVAAATVWTDVGFATAIATVTEGTSSPFYVFYSFALITVGLRFGLRRTLLVTAVSVLLYLSLILLGWHADDLNLIVMRPVYLAILGYLVGYMGDRRQELETAVRQLEASTQRVSIARALHDGSCQALAGVNLRLQTCRALLEKGRVAEVGSQLADLQSGVTREYDELRRYVRSLTDLEASAAAYADVESPTRFTIRLDFTGVGERTDHVLQIVREAVANVRRHARAGSATVTCVAHDHALLIRIDDDGVGFAHDTAVPWSIASRTAELGGTARIVPGEGPGAHLAVTVPRADP
jgi:signal transduction histidine kinase